MNVIRALTKIAINRLGYDIRRVASPKAYRVAEAGSDPITFEYLPKRRGHAVFEVPIVEARAFEALALPLRPECHPFVMALQSALRADGEGAARSSIESVLRSYYDTTCPATAVEVVDVPPDKAPGLRGVEPFHYVWPWGAQSVAEMRVGRRRSATYEGLQNGVLARAGEGLTNFGPVTPAKLSLEVDRLSRLAASVKSRGFIRFDRRAPLKVGAFRRGDQYKWIINSGQHRFAMAAALGIELVPAIVTEVVRREDARYWPQVTSGVFTEEGALSVFDRMFEGAPASICQAWICGNGPSPRGASPSAPALAPPSELER